MTGAPTCSPSASSCTRCLSGRAPYEATTPGQYFILHSKETPNPVTLHNLSFPEAPGLEKILARALEKDREQRYATAKEFAKALSVLLAKLEETDLEPTAVFQSTLRLRAAADRGRNRQHRADPAAETRADPGAGARAGADGGGGQDCGRRAAGRGAGRDDRRDAADRAAAPGRPAAGSRNEPGR